MTAIRILIVDDHPVVRAGLSGMLQSQPDFELVGEAENGHQALAMVESRHPDLVLMDLRMPEMDGVAATTRIKATAPEVQVLVLTTYDTDADILRAIQAGAIGYLLKDTPRSTLFAAIRSAAEGQPSLAPGVAARLMNKVRETGEEALTVREIEVLNLVAGGRANGEIAKQLRISIATVKTHLAHIYGKLAVSDRTAAVTKALERGIIRLDG